jgi:integrase
VDFTNETAAELSLPNGKSEHFEWDPKLPGFGIRVRAGKQTKRTWVVQYRVNGEQRRESLGDVRRVDVDDARGIARKRFAQVELDIDPAAERAKMRAEAATIKLTLGATADRYLEAKRDVLRPSTYKAAKQYFTAHWKPLRDRPLGAINRTEVAARLQDLIREHGRTSAARARDYLRALFAWAMKEGLCEANPVLATNDPSEGIPSRDRVLSDEELRAIWKACRDDDFGRIVRLLLLTGCRREEIAALKWDEINLETGVLTIPGARTKNHRTLELTLPLLTISILKSAPNRGRDFVFGAGGRGGFSAFSYSTMALNSRLVEAEGKALARWTLHDCRRTMRSGLGKLGVRPDVAELCINHVKKGVEAIYDRHRYQHEIKVALASWADHVAALVESNPRETNVTTLRRA